MEKLTIQDGSSLDVVSENLEVLKGVFPEAFTEDGVDFEVLRQLLGDAVDDGEEKYGLNWYGKKKARQIALTPSMGTLRPCPEESVDWDTTKNMMIEGDNLEVLKLLQKSYAGKVDLIYIDPPYNKGKEFIYPDKYQDNLDTYLRYTRQVDSEGLKATSNTESSGRFHTNWLNMMFSRLKLAKNLLRNTGVIAISIGDEELDNLLQLCSEIFGEENKVTVITWEKGRKNDSTFFSESVEYMVIYAKSKSSLIEKGSWRERKPGIDEALGKYAELRAEFTNHSIIEERMKVFYKELPEGDPTKTLAHFYRSDAHGLYFGGDISSASTSIPDYEVYHPKTGKTCRKPSRGWGCNPDEMERRIKDNRVHFGDDETTIPLKKNYLFEVDSIVKTPVIYKDGRAATRFQKNIFGKVVFENPKDHNILAEIFSYCCKDGGIVVDFFAGSGTTAHAAWLNCLAGKPFNFILVQLPEKLDPQKKEHKNAMELGFKNIAELTAERLRRTVEALNPDSSGNVDFGFKLFKLDSSNIRAWNPDRNDLEQTLIDHMEHLVEGRSEEDILYELLLKRGVDLTIPIEKKVISGKTVYSIGYGVLFACLDTLITRDEVEDLAMGIIDWQKQLEPASDTQVVFRNSAFADNVASTNMTAILEQNGISYVRSL